MVNENKTRRLQHIDSEILENQIAIQVAELQNDKIKNALLL